MAKSRELDMTQGSIVKNVIVFSIPLMLSGILQLLYNAADIVVVGRFAGSEALAAVGSNGALINLLVGVFLNLAVGTSVLVAKSYGAKDYNKTQEVLHTSVALALFSGILMVIIGLFLSKKMLVLMDCPDEIINLSDLYLKIYFLGAPANVFYNFGSMALRAVGDTKRPLVFLTISGIVNVVLNLVFVIVFHMSVAGVAIATIVSQYLSAIMVFICLKRESGFLHLDLKNIKFSKESVIGILKIGIPAGISGIVFSTSNVIVQASLNSFGANIVAGNSAAANIEGFIYTALNSFSQAAVTIVGQNYGAKKFDRIGKSAMACAIVVFIIGEVMGILGFVFGRQLLSLYSSDVQVIEYGMIRVMITFPIYFTCGIMDVFSGAMRGLGNSFVPMIVSIVGVCGARIAWIFTLFAMNRTLEMLYISYPVSWAMTALIQFLTFMFMKKKVTKNAILQ